PGLLAGLRINEADLGAILADQSLDPNGTLDVATLNRLHRFSALARGLGMHITEFLRLIRISGVDPFASPSAAVGFVELADYVAASPFSVFELDYLLTNHFTVNSGVALEDRSTVTFLTQLRQGLAEINDRLRHKADQS